MTGHHGTSFLIFYFKKFFFLQPIISVHNVKSFHIVSIISWSRCLSWRAALHRGPVLSEPVPKQRHMQSTRGRLLVLLRAGFPGRPLPDWREWVCLRALRERRHLWGPSGQLLLSVSSWVHWWVNRTVLGIFSLSSSLKEKIKDCFWVQLLLCDVCQWHMKRHNGGGRVWQN